MVKLQVEEIISFIFLKFNPMLLDCCSVIKQQRISFDSDIGRYELHDICMQFISAFL